ncbi:MAG: Gx transporter family protein [Deltaproteobacteria bacterium]|uniref:Gx transporter family protein n=1 Tax=Candidatus Zymogenus saltonus TaxID=2844893 RepID=A0A9D8KH62_9DELT|nr:Gx transporter family protein [Candidatus Zymogenus saltonus]
MERERKIVTISLLAGLSVVIYALESFIPSPVPWLRYGFSHIIILFVLLFFSYREALLIFLVRTLIGSLIVGRLFSPTFFFGLCGGFSALVVMAGLLYVLKGRGLGIVGISVSGAWVNSLVQMLIAAVLFARHREIFLFLPVSLIFAVAMGIVNGIAVYYLNGYGQKALGFKGRYFPLDL